MTGIDTNILVYAIDRADLVKWSKSRALLRQLRADPSRTVLPWQVVAELVRYLRSQQDRGLGTRADLVRYLNRFRKVYTLVMPTPAVLDRALDLSGRYSLSHWDSMLLGACAEAGVDTLYTEDMGAPVVVDGIRLVNPFV